MSVQTDKIIAEALERGTENLLTKIITSQTKKTNVQHLKLHRMIDGRKRLTVLIFEEVK